MTHARGSARGFATAALLVLAAPFAAAVDAPPAYELQYLGPGSPVAISNTGVVAGARLSGSSYTPLVSIGGRAFAPLPVPAGAVSTFPTDVNDAGVIVGVSFDAQMNPRALRWRDAGAGYAVEVLPRLPGDASSYATAINNLGQITGARRTLGYVPTGGGWLLDGSGLVDLQARYGWVVVPSDLNDAGQLIGGAERLDLATGALQWIGDGPANYNPVTGVAINASGMIAGAASLRSTSLNIVSVFRYEGAAGWRMLAGSSRYTVASSINSRGDVGYGELGAGLYFDGLGTFAVNDLLTPATLQAGWAVTGNGAEINDQRVVATIGRNSISGESGGVLLTPVGALQAPTAPVNLVARAHPATGAEPFDAIILSWQNTSALTGGYELQRSVAGAGSWVALQLVAPGTATQHTDTTVSPGVTYDYRVRATGLGGASPWSSVATATAPSVVPVARLHVESIQLSGQRIGRKASIQGYVAIRDAAGAAVPGAGVTVRWTLPGGAIRNASASTDSAGRARFSTSGSRGTYVLTVSGVSKQGYVFDAAASVLSASITR